MTWEPDDPRDISALEIGMRAYNALKAENLTTVSAVARMPLRDLMRVPGIGPLTASEIQTALGEHRRRYGDLPPPPSGSSFPPALGSDYG